MILFPAHAGVILIMPDTTYSGRTFPRTRGGDPPFFHPPKGAKNLFPAHAGVIPRNGSVFGRGLAFPRTRGGDPAWRVIRNLGSHFSPHTRG